MIFQLDRLETFSVFSLSLLHYNSNCCHFLKEPYKYYIIFFQSGFYFNS